MEIEQKRSTNYLINADEEMLNYLAKGDGERKDKFKNFCHHFGLD